MPVSEREITRAVDMCLPTGRPDPAAVGWSRRPLHRANLRGWGRCKRWEYWGVVTPRHIVGVVVSSLDYAGVHGIYVLDRDLGTEVRRDAVAPLASGTVLPPGCLAGTASARAGDLAIDVHQSADVTAVRASAPGVVVEVDVPRPAGRDCLAVLVPWSGRRFQYTVKDVGRPASGRLRLAGEEFAISPDDSFAVLDHGRGRWPYAVTWNWAAGSLPGGRLAVQFGGRWTDGTGVTENGLFVDGRLHKIGADLRWSYDVSRPLLPWRITGPGVEVEFHPFHDRVARTNLLVVAGQTHQCFGRFTGRVRDGDGTWVDVDGLTGWAEEARNRW